MARMPRRCTICRTQGMNSGEAWRRMQLARSARSASAARARPPRLGAGVHRVAGASQRSDDAHRTERRSPAGRGPACLPRSGSPIGSAPLGSESRTPPLHRLDQRSHCLVDAAEAGVEVRVRQPVGVREDRPRGMRTTARATSPGRADGLVEARGPGAAPSRRGDLPRWADLTGPARGAHGQRSTPRRRAASDRRRVGGETPIGATARRNLASMPSARARASA